METNKNEAANFTTADDDDNKCIISSRCFD